mmetsp:Transcript_2879/g.6065  ORF Transcript_2879/g.6065 Transcript_2879/m.6065 type:complete len:327 (-) Transcript_2879:155-1135(-)
MLLFCLLLAAVNVAAEWRCITTADDVSLSASGSVKWQVQNCSMDADGPPLLKVNSLVIDLTSKDVRVLPAVSKDPNNLLASVPDQAASNPDRNFIAGINGGYFWRVDITPIWVDDVCRGKKRSEAEHEAGEDANWGLHDGLIKVDSEVLGSNCDCKGFSRPAVVSTSTTDMGDYGIEVLQRGEQGSADIVYGLGAGPNLVSFNASTGESYVDIPADDDNINIHEHAANSAVGLVLDPVTGKAVTMLLVTTDGSDECGRLDPSCGITATNLAQLLKEHFLVTQAMSMDQGGSTTMWVKAATDFPQGVVSYAGGGARAVANSFMVELL